MLDESKIESRINRRVARAEFRVFLIGFAGYALCMTVLCGIGIFAAWQTRVEWSGAWQLQQEVMRLSEQEGRVVAQIAELNRITEQRLREISGYSHSIYEYVGDAELLRNAAESLYKHRGCDERNRVLPVSNRVR